MRDDVIKPSGNEYFFFNFQLIIQIVFFILTIYFIIKSLYIYINIRKISKKQNKINEAIDNEEKDVQLKHNKLQLIISILLTILSYFGYKVAYIIRNMAVKPVIYVYPKEIQKTNIKLVKTENLTCTYPKYKSSWNVLAYPDGKLIDLNTNRELYCLYWEGKNKKRTIFNEGFCVKGSESSSFLEEKLKILGLNPKESEEFIIYWLPILEKNKFNLIRFQETKEIDTNMPLDISPKPDTVIRIMMEFKGCNKFVKIPEQKLEKVERKGYTVVEWGGIK